MCWYSGLSALDYSRPLTSQRLCFSSFSITRFSFVKSCNLQAELTISFIQVEMRETFFPTAQIPSSPFLSRSLFSSRNNSHETILHIQKEEREIVYRKSHPLSLFLSPYNLLSRSTRQFFLFFFRDLSIRSRDRSTSWYVYNVIFTDSLQKNSMHCTWGLLCVRRILRDEDEDLRPLVSLSRLTGNLSCLSCSFSLLSLYHK